MITVLFERVIINIKEFKEYVRRSVDYYVLVNSLMNFVKRYMI